MIMMAAAQSSAEAAISIVGRVLLLVALLIPLAAATLWLRRWAHHDAGDQPTVGFTLRDVQEMYKRGELDQAQYDPLRQEIVTQARRTLDAKVKPGESKDDKTP